MELGWGYRWRWESVEGPWAKDGFIPLNILITYFENISLGWVLLLGKGLASK
jgi:hypothetical protein